MASSLSFARIERDILKLCATIPTGRVCTYADAGAVIDVPARHVAYIVSRLKDTTRAQYPVHRLVGNGGKLPAKPADLARLLAQEGVIAALGVVVNLPSVRYAPSSATAHSAKLERTTRPPEHTRGADGSAALSELRGLGPVSIAMLGSVGITNAAQLRKVDIFLLFEKIKTLHPRTSINLLYALLGAADNQDWRTVARERRTEVLMRLEDMGLL
jgi:DNA transformation protein and related proteins